MPQFLSGIASLVPRFDGFILDLWGVLHDGTHPYPGAIEALAKLRAEGKKIILLSNAPRRAAAVEKVLQTIGFSSTHYDALVTSGDTARDWLLASRPYGLRYCYIGPEKDRHLLEGADYREVSSATEADFALVTGFNEFGDGMETKLPQVRESLAAKLPMICTNPDRLVVKQDGREMLCAGLLAEWYEAHGGHVDWFGKPYRRVYEHCFALFRDWGLGVEEGSGAPRNPHHPSSIIHHPILAIGDSLHTDIAGARGAGITCVLVAGGILAEPLDVKPGELPDPDCLARLCAAEGTDPDIVIPAFRW